MRLQLEGQDLESLLTRVHEEYGAGARIVQAEKVRSGGVGGFFAREHFAMTVEVDDQPTPFAAEDVPDTPAALLGLADSVSRHEVSTTTAGFAEVLRRLAESAGEPEQAEPAAAEPAAAAQDEEFRPFDVRPGALPPAQTEAAPTPAPVPTAAVARVTTPARRRSGVRRGSSAAGATLRALGLPTRLIPVEPMPDLYDALSWSLAGLTPPDLRAPAAGDLIAVIGEPRAALDVARGLARRWGADPEAVALAAASTDLGIVPARQRLADAAALYARRSRDRRRGLPLVIAVDERLALHGDHRAAWPGGVLSHLHEATRIGVVSASAKPADMQHWVDRVGGVAGLAVVDLDGSTSPATVLATGLPVLLVDQRPATAATWASLLCERVASQR